MRRLLGNRRLALLALVVLAAVLAVEVVALTGSGDDGVRRTDDDGRVLAGDFARAITSFDHRRLDADITRVLALGTPGFERDFRQAMGEDFPTRVVDNRTVSSGRIVSGPRLHRVRGRRATFLVVVHQKITNEGAQADQPPTVDQVLLLVTVDGRSNKVATVQEAWRS